MACLMDEFAVVVFCTSKEVRENRNKLRSLLSNGLFLHLNRKALTRGNRGIRISAFDIDTGHVTDHCCVKRRESEL